MASKEKKANRNREVATLMSAKFAQAAITLYVSLRHHVGAEPEQQYRIYWRKVDGDTSESGCSGTFSDEKKARATFEDSCKLLVEKGNWSRSALGTRPGRKVTLSDLPMLASKSKK